MSEYITNIKNWECLKVLGSGAFGSVTQWQNKHTGFQVAVKMCKVRQEELKKEELIKLTKRWNNEVEIMLKLKHENVVQACSEVCSDLLNAVNETIDTKLPAIAMEFCDGGNLREKLQEKQNLNGLSEYEVREVLHALGSAVHYLHTQHKITHRDIKPDNIVLKIGSDGRTIYKLADVGYARDIDVNTILASMVGTIHYFAPEIPKYAEYKNCVDYWSMGVVAYEIMCGIVPFLPGESFTEVIHAIEKKPHDCIAITKVFEQTPIYQNKLRPENRLTSIFRELIILWLRIALNQDGHRRGYNADGELVFYKTLESILSTKVLTVFWINGSQLLTYNLNEIHTMKQLFTMIWKDTNSAGTKVNLFLSSGHRSLQMTEDPKQCYDERLFIEDRPMMYLATFVSETLLNSTEPTIPVTIRTLFSGPVEPITAATLEQCMLDVWFLHQNIERQCIYQLNGINEFAMNLEDELLQLQPMVHETSRLIYEYRGQVEHFETMVITGKQFIEQEFSEILREMEDRVEYFKNVYTSDVYARYDKALSCTREFIKSHQASIVVSALEKLTNKVRLFQEYPLNKRPNPKYADQITSMMRTATVDLITARKEFMDSLNIWLTNKTPVDSLVALMKEYMQIGGDLQEIQKRLNYAKEKVTQATKDFFDKSVHLKKGKQKALEYHSMLEQMETLDISVAEQMSTGELLRFNDKELRQAMESFDDVK